jgi:hypothetical protein
VGTSKSYDGPKDRTPLLPPWAFPEADDGEQPLPALPDDSKPNQPAGEQPLPEPSQPSPGSSWRTAKVSLGKAISGGSGVRGSFAAPGRKYVGALGGARNAARTSRAGKASTARLGQFLSSVSSRGLNETLERLGLSSVIGKDAETVFAAISNALAPTGSSREEAIARSAVNEALELLYEQLLLADGDLTKLDQMGTQEVTQAIQAAVSSYIFCRWLAELEIVLEKKAMSAKEAVRYERDMRAYIRESVQLDMQGIDVLNMDWNGAGGKQFIDKIFTDAYRILEEGQ